MASIYSTMLDALLRGDAVVVSANAEGRPPKAQTLRQNLSEQYAAYKRSLERHEIAYTPMRLKLTPLDGGAVEVRLVEHTANIPTFTVRSAHPETQHERNPERNPQCADTAIVDAPDELADL